VRDNPEMQGKEYIVVRTKKGYFITPGNGVKLPNGVIIGQNLILDENADIQEMMNNRNKLYFHGRALAAKIAIHGQNNGRFADAWRMDN
jgi:S-adenosylmethionine hydrolase